MSRVFNFGGGMQGFGREVLRELVKTSHGPGYSFSGIVAQSMWDDHCGLHDHVNLFQEVIKDSGMNFRFFKNK